MRELTLMVYVYEGTVDQRFTYAPTAYKVNDKRIYLNLSQEGLDDICDLRDRDLAEERDGLPSDVQDWWRGPRVDGCTGVCETHGLPGNHGALEAAQREGPL